MNLDNVLNNSNEINNEVSNEVVTKESQNSFLETGIGKAINTGIDIGIRAILPDVVEDQIINIKDNLLNYGLKDGISKTVEEAINFGKSALGIITGNFENISQMQMAVKKGGIIDSISGIFDTAINQISKKGIINSNVANLIKQGKNTILNSIEGNIEKSFTNQIDSVNNLEKHIDNWKKYYNNHDFANMEKQYKKIEKELSKVVPLEKTLNAARTVENIHSLIKTNGQNFELTETEQELLRKLS